MFHDKCTDYVCIRIVFLPGMKILSFNLIPTTLKYRTQVVGYKRQDKIAESEIRKRWLRLDFGMSYFPPDEVTSSTFL